MNIITDRQLLLRNIIEACDDFMDDATNTSNFKNNMKQYEKHKKYIILII